MSARCASARSEGTASLRLITLDLDDTLWPIRPTIEHAERTLGQWLEQRCPGFLVRWTPARIAELRGKIGAQYPQHRHDLTRLRELTLAQMLEPWAVKQALLEAAMEVFLEARHQVQLYPEARSALRRLAAHAPLLALSNGNADVKRLGLGSYFTGSLSAREHGAAKPAAEIFLAACSAAGVQPSECLHVGDHPDQDVRGASAAGLRAAWLCRDTQLQWPGDDPPSLRFSCLASLADWLEVQPWNDAFDKRARLA